MRAPDFDLLRRQMVRDQLVERGIRDPRVLEAMGKVRRHLFVSPEHQPEGYEDRPLPIGFGQTISQPYIVAYMIEQLQLPPEGKVLEVGTGSGYQAAVLAEMGARVYSVERLPALARQAGQRLRELGLRATEIHVGDGSGGWPEQAPFDGIVVAACAPRVPDALVKQLAEGGRMVIPIGEAFSQSLTLVERCPDRIRTETLCGCLFVPLVEERDDPLPG